MDGELIATTAPTFAETVFEDSAGVTNRLALDLSSLNPWNGQIAAVHVYADLLDARHWRGLYRVGKRGVLS